ncbi:hypothetical protein, partial [Rhizobium rhizogenes]|uniref:hypothetical protein n=1 Tax=Rhizobium rhizogenes TaxID=359 RepID=UPI001AEDCB38
APLPQGVDRATQVLGYFCVPQDFRFIEQKDQSLAQAPTLVLFGAVRPLIFVRWFDIGVASRGNFSTKTTPAFDWFDK